MPDIFAYLDYRKFLMDVYEEGRSVGLTHRELGRRGGFDPGLVSKVLEGERNISPSMVPKFCKAFGLGEREARFFALLVRQNQARRQSDRKRWLDEVLVFGKERIGEVVRTQIEYYEHWYYTAMRELINAYPGKSDPGELAELLSPAVTPRQARQAIQVLQRLGMVEDDGKGGLKVTHALVSSGHESQPTGVNHFIQEGVELARTALDRFDPQERNLSTLTFSCSAERFVQLVERIRAFRREIMLLVESDPAPDRVFQMNLQLFPMSLDPRSVKGRRRLNNREKP